MYPATEEEYDRMNSDVEYCRLCHDLPATTSDGCCHYCADKYPVRIDYKKPIVDVVAFTKNDSGACLTQCKRRKKETVMVGSSSCFSCPKNIATDYKKMVVACITT